MAAAVAELEALEGCEVTAMSLRARPVAVRRPVYAVLRRRDLLGLFDTAPDLSGSDIDVAPFIRVADDLDVQVAWRPLPPGGPGQDEPTPAGDELCPVPLGRELRDALAHRPAWRFDHLQGGWVRLDARDARAGMVVLMDAASGCYRPDVGWDPASHTVVEPVVVGGSAEVLVDRGGTAGCRPGHFRCGKVAGPASAFGRRGGRGSSAVRRSGPRPAPSRFGGGGHGGRPSPRHRQGPCRVPGHHGPMRRRREPGVGGGGTAVGQVRRPEPCPSRPPLFPTRVGLGAGVAGRGKNGIERGDRARVGGVSGGRGSRPGPSRYPHRARGGAPGAAGAGHRRGRRTPGGGCSWRKRARLSVVVDHHDPGTSRGGWRVAGANGP